MMSVQAEGTVEAMAAATPGALATPRAYTWLDSLGLAGPRAWLEHHPPLASGVGLLLVFLLALGALYLARGHLLRFIGAFARRSSTAWDDLLLQKGLFHRLSWAVPLVVVHQLLPVVPHLPTPLLAFLQRVAMAALVLIALRALGALLTVVNDIYSRYPMARNRPIKGYLQVLLIAAWVVGVVLIIAMLMDRSPLLLLSGLGAMTAILLLVFRDTLLSLVAGVQLTINNLIRVGDWIEMPQFGADGEVVDIALHAVTVQNWDRTLTVIPTHRFLEHSFKNWRGMTDSGGRRIKRAFHVDLSSIRFLDAAEIERFSRFVLLRDYMLRKKAELEAYNREHLVEPGLVANARRLTNVGTLRAYISAYLRQHPKVHQDMVCMVRQLAPTPEGLPLEIYVFSNDTAWVNYEGIQADLFDHVLAMVPEFGLRVYQKPSGADLSLLATAHSRPGGVNQLAEPAEEPRRASGTR
jgi:miniconductance mechanosensitive channel